MTGTNLLILNSLCINVKGIKTKSEPYKIHSASDSDHAKERGRMGEGRDTGQSEEQELQLEQLLQKEGELDTSRSRRDGEKQRL